MQLYPILLVVVVVAADAAPVLPLPAAPPGGWQAAAVAVAPPALLVATASLLVTMCMRRLPRGGPRVLISAGRIVAAFRWLLLGWHAAAVLWLGWLATIRGAIGDLILIDELICLAPPVLAWAALWWVHHPVERRLREALQVRQLDLGAPIYSLPSRGEYVGQQTRSGLLLLLVPVLLIVSVSETIDIAAARWWYRDADAPGASMLDVAKLAGALLVFALAPFIARIVLTVRPLGAGEIRDMLQEVCRRHRVRIRDILVWHTSGSIINAAVMGLLGPLRYVLLTDALLESMNADQVEAVMAHEVAHVRRHHMPWLIVSLMAALSGTWLLLTLPFYLLGPIDVPVAFIELGLFATQIVVALLIFGWVSRRFERQADTFAVQHLSGMGHGVDAGAPTVRPEAVEAMSGALGRIAQLNTIDPRRHSWRHGSIAWRQHYLRSIVSHPVAGLPIDRLVRWIKLTAGIVLAGSMTTMFVLDGATGDADQGTETVIEFVKLHGIGNDYLFVDGATHAVDDASALSRAMSDRHFGVGADGLILVLPPSPGVDAHLRMRMFNADGSESEMCGNGIRGLCKFARDRGLCTARPMRVETGAGVLTLDYTLDADGKVDEVTVDMGAPTLEPASIPMTLPVGFEGDRVVDAPLESLFGDLGDLEVEPTVTCLAMGNPHAVIYCPSLERVPLATIGPRLECDPVFPNRVNVHFVRCDGPAELTMATWERGSGATLACGTGASAVCVAGTLTGRTEREVLAHLPGGDLRLRWDEATNHVFMTGPAREVFTGRWPTARRAVPAATG